MLKGEETVEFKNVWQTPVAMPRKTGFHYACYILSRGRVWGGSNSIPGCIKTAKEFVLEIKVGVVRMSACWEEDFKKNTVLT
jgi:hypothetical protein